eukprot:scaffold48560_cov61-Phaeocystis_antarctica.AAC.4
MPRLSETLSERPVAASNAARATRFIPPCPRSATETNSERRSAAAGHHSGRSHFPAHESTLPNQRT